MVKIEVLYEGDLRCRAKHVPSGSSLATDAPTDNLGRGEAFSPTDLIATALATCMATTMGIVARHENLRIEGTRIAITKTMSTGSPRRIIRLAADIHIPTEKRNDPKGLLEQAALRCPVYLSLSPDIDKPIRFHWA